MDFSGSAAASPARRFDGVPAGQWEILERQRQDLQQRREQLELAARRRAAAQEAARVQKVKNLQKRLVDLDKMQALARKRNSQLLADVMDLQNSAMNQRPEASTAQACLHEELRKFAAYVHNGREKWAQDRAQRRRAAARDQALSPNGAARAREREGAAAGGNEGVTYLHPDGPVEEVLELPVSRPPMSPGMWRLYAPALGAKRTLPSPSSRSEAESAADSIDGF